VTTVTSYNVRGWKDSVRVGSLTSTTFQYDPMGRQTRETAPLGPRTDLTYNGFDQLTQRRDFAQATPAITAYSYDAAGRLSVLDGPRTDVDDSLTSTYDLAGNLTQVRQNGIVLPGTSTVVTTDAFYNDVGERIQLAQPLTTSLTQVRNWVQDPAARTSTFSETRGTTTYTTTSHLEQAGWVSSITDPRGITLSFERDNLGRETRRYRSSPSVADDQTFTYDLAGNMLSARVVATGATISMDYDDDARLWKVYQASGSPTTTYTYSSTTGQLSQVTDPAGTASFTYRTGDGLISSITDPFAGLLTYTYDSAGRMTERN
jgi:YD repeat-containing protein